MGNYSELKGTFVFARQSNGTWTSDGSFPGATGAFALYGGRLLLARSEAVDVFRRNATTWAFEQTLTAIQQRSEGFGESIDIDGDLIAIGASGNGADFEDPAGRTEDNENAPRSGAVYVFERTGSGQAPWTIRYRLKAPVIEAGDGFGADVSLWNGIFGASSPGEDSRATGVNGNQNDNTRTDTGAAYIVVRQPPTSNVPPSDPGPAPVCPGTQRCCEYNADATCARCVSRGTDCL